MPEYTAPFDPNDPTLSQMCTEMRRLASFKEQKYPRSEGWYTAQEVQHVEGRNMSSSNFNNLLAAARRFGRLEEQRDWRRLSDGSWRAVRVFRLNNETTEEPSTDG